MQEIEIIMYGVAATFILYNTFYEWGEDGWILFRSKPFSCDFCLSVWVSMAAGVYCWSLYSILIPIAYRVTTKIIKRL